MDILLKFRETTGHAGLPWLNCRFAGGLALSLDSAERLIGGWVAVAFAVQPGLFVELSALRPAVLALLFSAHRCVLLSGAFVCPFHLTAHLGGSCTGVFQKFFVTSSFHVNPLHQPFT